MATKPKASASPSSKLPSSTIDFEADAKKPKSRAKPIEPELKAIMDRIAALPSLDALYARDPHGDKANSVPRRALIEHHRQERAMWTFKNDRKEARKEEKDAAKENGEEG